MTIDMLRGRFDHYYKRIIEILKNSKAFQEMVLDNCATIYFQGYINYRDLCLKKHQIDIEIRKD